MNRGPIRESVIQELGDPWPQGHLTLGRHLTQDAHLTVAECDGGWVSGWECG